MNNFEKNGINFSSNKNPVIRRKTLKTTYIRTNKRKINFNWSKVKKIAIRIAIWLLAFSFVGSILVYSFFLKDLPSIWELQNLDIAESSIIYDRDWNVLYNIYKEKRTYVEFENIHKNMINALVAWEDKRYWENPWIDIIWLWRAFIYWILWKNEWFWGTSTLTQQLIRNTIIENRSSSESIFEKLARKIKEVYLAYKLTNWLSKEKIIELYLNKIWFWSNAYWVEQASKTFFNKKASELNVLEASILASLPKWPTYYSPYTHPDRLMWYPLLLNKDDEWDKIEIITTKDYESNKENVDILKNYIANLKWKWVNNSDRIVICWVKKEDFKISINVDKDWCIDTRYQDLLTVLNWIRLKNWDYNIEYQIGRKDFILWRMLEDWYINFDEYKTAILDSIAYVFNQERENITAPHFVFYVKEYLEQKYWKEIISVWWFHIYTTLDSNLQNKANEIIQKQVQSNTKNFNATNAALISIDNSNWDILAMVWWVDYFDQENKWNVNIITSKLQPWSSFKPFVYSLWIYNNEIGSKTPIYDLKMTFPWNYTPKNFDWGFLWKMDVSTALWNSRNIPAIQMYYMAWWEANIINFMKKLWVESLQWNWQYWAPLALWTWEMTPLELATAYSVFANLWEKVEINPILKIVDSKGNIIEEKWEPKKEKVISEAQSYVINSILSDTTSRPASRNNYIDLPDRPVASKTGTSTKQYEKNWVKTIYPANLWTIWYTPQITTVVWAWNTDWSQVWMKWDWLNWAWPIWRNFMTYAHKDKKVKNWTKPNSVYSINVSEISWLLPNPENNSSPLVKSLFVNKPTKYDQSFQTVKIDTLCWWKATADTPDAAIKDVTLVEFHWINPSNASWEAAVQEWAKSDEAKEKYWNLSNIVTSVSNETCNRSWKQWNGTLKSNLKEGETYNMWENYLELWYKSTTPIKSAEILLDWTITQTLKMDWKKEWVYVWTIFFPAMYKNKNVKVEIRIIDDEYYSTSEINNVFVGAWDLSAPVISVTNPSWWSIKLYEWNYFNLRASVEDTSKVNTKIYIDGNLKWEYGDTRRLEIPINQDNSLAVWNYVIKIESIDSTWNKSSQNVNLEIMKK